MNWFLEASYSVISFILEDLMMISTTGFLLSDREARLLEETKINSIVTLWNAEQWINNEINSMLIF